MQCSLSRTGWGGGRRTGITLFSSRGGNGPSTELARSLPASRLRELGFHSVPVSESLTRAQTARRPIWEDLFILRNAKYLNHH